MSDLYRLFPRDSRGYLLIDPESTLSLAAVDRDMLAEVPWPHCQPWVQARIDEYLGYVRALRTVYNDAALIHCLPNELLTKIFGQCVDIRVSHVCRRWRALALATPALWANLVNQDAKPIDQRLQTHPSQDARFVDVVEAIFARSGSCTLRPMFGHFSAAHVELLTAKRSQIAALHLCLEDSSQTRVFYAAVKAVGGMPNLTELDMESYPNEIARYDQAECWSDDDLPSLRTLSVNGPSLRAEHVVSSIRTLTVQGPSPCAAKPLIEALRRCHHLEVLRIEPMTMPPTAIPLVLESSPGIVRLPALKELHTFHGDRRTWDFTTLLSHLDFPETTFVSVSLWGGRSGDAISTFHTDIACRRMRMVTEVELLGGGANLQLVGGAATLRFSVNQTMTLVVELRSGYISVEDLEYILSSTPSVMHLRLRIDVLREARGRKLPSLCRAPQLRRLHIQDMNGLSDEYGHSIERSFMHHLGNTQGPDGTIPCPLLEELLIERPLPANRLHSGTTPTEIRSGIWHMQDVWRELDGWIASLGDAAKARGMLGSRLSRIGVRWWNSQPDLQELDVWPQQHADDFAEKLVRHVSESASVSLPPGTYTATKHHVSG